MRCPATVLAFSVPAKPSAALPPVVRPGEERQLKQVYVNDLGPLWIHNRLSPTDPLHGRIADDFPCQFQTFSWIEGNPKRTKQITSPAGTCFLFVVSVNLMEDCNIWYSIIQVHTLTR